MLFNIKGIPCSFAKKRGDKKVKGTWGNAIIEQTKHLETVDYPCELSVQFVLPENKFPKDYPYGLDLDNMLKLLLDSFQKTFLKDDNLIIKLTASKRKARNLNECGAKGRISKAEGI